MPPKKKSELKTPSSTTEETESTSSSTPEQPNHKKVVTKKAVTKKVEEPKKVAKKPADKVSETKKDKSDNLRTFELDFNSIIPQNGSAEPARSKGDLKLELIMPGKNPGQVAKNFFNRICKVSSDTDVGCYVFSISDITNFSTDDKNKPFVYKGERTKEPGKKEGETVVKVVVRAFKPEESEKEKPEKNILEDTKPDTKSVTKPDQKEIKPSKKDAKKASIPKKDPPPKKVSKK